LSLPSDAPVAMKLEICNLYDTWCTEDTMINARVARERIPPSRDGTSQWPCVRVPDRRVLFTQLISQCDEMRDIMYWYCLLIDQQAFQFLALHHDRFQPLGNYALYDLLGMDEQVFLACAWRKLDDRNRAISDAWARTQAARAAEIASSRSGS
jgi:hypothetical protein